VRGSIADSLRQISTADLADLVDAASHRQSQSPAVSSATFAASHIDLRGGTVEWPLSICLTIDQAERCRSAPGLKQLPRWQNGVLLGGRWYIVGRQPVGDPPPILYPWAPDLRIPLKAAGILVMKPSQSMAVGEQLLWFTEIPESVDAVQVGYVNGDDIVITQISFGSPTFSAFRRPDF
jgi:hypothetical protein